MEDIDDVFKRILKTVTKDREKFKKLKNENLRDGYVKSYPAPFTLKDFDYATLYPTTHGDFSDFMNKLKADERKQKIDEILKDDEKDSE